MLSPEQLGVSVVLDAVLLELLDVALHGLDLFLLLLEVCLHLQDSLVLFDSDFLHVLNLLLLLLDLGLQFLLLSHECLHLVVLTHR